MSQVGQVFELKAGGPDGKKLWAYRHRAGGRGSRRVQQGGFESERAAAEALERALGRLRRERGLVEAPRLSELVDVYLAQHGRAGDGGEAALAAREGDSRVWPSSGQ